MSRQHEPAPARRRDTTGPSTVERSGGRPREAPAPTVDLGRALRLGHAVPGPRVQRHGGRPESDDTTAPVVIYKVIEKSSGDVVYVGQTEESIGIDKRFDQHLAHPSHAHWSKASHEIKRIEAGDWTTLEANCSEQYWIDQFGGKDNLENARNQISRARFEQWQQDPNFGDLFRGTAIGFPANWKPAN